VGEESRERKRKWKERAIYFEISEVRGEGIYREGVDLEVVGLWLRSGDVLLDLGGDGRRLLLGRESRLEDFFVEDDRTSGWGEDEVEDEESLHGVVVREPVIA